MHAQWIRISLSVSLSLSRFPNLSTLLLVICARSLARTETQSCPTFPISSRVSRPRIPPNACTLSLRVPRLLLMPQRHHDHLPPRLSSPSKQSSQSAVRRKDRHGAGR
ncbi:unnamed protein product [Periconia digitata]|uniref:Secreted protein n=1 Tax=Periconia digitata TaxID=1303443 RepID=A0A9W4UGS3_9PLEO|nr:unnamed protein product [Periconia digitata]